MKTEIKINKLKKTYPNGFNALRKINLNINKGDFFALIGPNGAGKSTLVKILTRLIDKDSGNFSIGLENTENSFTNIQNYIGVVSQENELDPTEKVADLLQFQGQLFNMSKKEAFEKADQLIELFKLNKERNKKVNLLSGGNKRRLHCALALVHNPKVLFLDEATVGLDPLARTSFWDIINDLNKNNGVTIFLTTQYLEEAEKYANKIGLILNGKIHYSGTVDSFKSKISSEKNISLEDSYLSYVNNIENCEHGGDINETSL